MITALSNNNFEAEGTAFGARIVEKKKGSIRLMVIVLLGCVAACVVAMVSKIGMFIVYAAAIVAVGTLIALVLKLTRKSNPEIIVDAARRELNLRGRVVPFDQITDCYFEEKDWMGKTAVLIWLSIDGKKTSLFSMNMLSDDPASIERLAVELKGILVD